MPTQRARLTITETPEVADRLDLAAKRFPELADRRRELLLRLTELGERAMLEQSEGNRRATAKRRILARTAEITEPEAEAMLAERERDWAREPTP